MGWNLLGAAASVYGVHQANKNVDKQLRAQSEENRKMREYNLQLAKLQNYWNRQQWTLENSYNSPSAQISRMRAAGLNPDMMYGGGVSGNLSASSPQMTSGAPASPMDFSALGSKRTVLDVALQKATLDQMNAQTGKIESETEGVDIENDWKPLEKAFGLELTKSQIALNRKELQHIGAKIENLQSSTLNLEQDLVLKRLDEVFNTRTMESRVKSLAEAARKAGYDADKAEADAQVALRTVMSRIAFQDAQTERSQHEAASALEEKFIKQFENDSQGFKLFLDCLDRGIDIFDAFLDFKDFQNRRNKGKLTDN